MQAEQSPPKKPTRRRNLIIISGVLLVLACICVAVIASQPSSDATPTSAPAVAQEQATELSEQVGPSETVGPTNTPEPTETPAPTNKPRPTNTPQPTETPEPTLEPIVLTGSGDSIVDVSLPRGFAGIVHIIGNSASRHFAVTSLDENNEMLNLLVNTTDPYDGIRPLDFFDDEHTVRFEVNAAGEWSIEILELTSARILEVPGTIDGLGDDIIIISGGTPDIAHITGNEASRHFAVTSYGDDWDLLVNTTDPYDGTVIMSRGAVIVEVQAEGAWTIEVTAK